MKCQQEPNCPMPATVHESDGKPVCRSHHEVNQRPDLYAHIDDGAQFRGIDLRHAGGRNSMHGTTRE
jgi:hypothetical protein